MGPQEDTHTEPDNDNSRSLSLTTRGLFLWIMNLHIHNVRRQRFRLGLQRGQENDDEWGLRKTHTQSQIMIIPGAIL